MDRVTHLALCWRVERRDGVAIGLTDHDRDLEIDGMVYRAAPGMTPSAIVRGDGLDPRQWMRRARCPARRSLGAT